MHSSSRTSHDTASAVDRLAEWLLTNCPFSTLTILALLVLGFAFSIPRAGAGLVVAVVVGADLLLNLARRHRRTRQARPARVVTA